MRMVNRLSCGNVFVNRIKERKYGRMINNIENGSRAVSKAAVNMAMSDNREDENSIKNELLERGIRSVAVDFGGDFLSSVPKILERAVVAAKREGVIGSTHAEEGAVAGAAHEAICQIQTKCAGLNLGGKIGIARSGSHLSVCLFFALGLLNLNDIVIGLGHRAV